MVREEVLVPLARQIRPILATLVPATVDLSDAELQVVLARVDERLNDEPPALRRQLRLFVRVLYYLPLLTRLRTLGGLSPAARESFLLAVQDASITKVRLGLWGLRTLLYLGWYGDPAVQARLGYRPNAAGWEAWQGPPPSVPLSQTQGRR